MSVVSPLNVKYILLLSFLKLFVKLIVFLLFQYKRKRSSSDPASVKIEGEQTNDWFAIDLGMLMCVTG